MRPSTNPLTPATRRNPKEPEMTAATRPTAATKPANSPPWPLERILFALAGTMTLLSAALAAVVSPWFLLLTAFVGINQWLYVTVRNCPASLVLRRHAQPQCRW
jgi:hypothetical protein